MYEAESFAPLGLSLCSRRPTAYAVGCTLPPLRGWVSAGITERQRCRTFLSGYASAWDDGS